MWKWIIIWCTFAPLKFEKEIECNHFRMFSDRQQAVDFYQAIKYNNVDTLYHFDVKLDSVFVPYIREIRK